jgi:hypothetical protein
LEGLGAGLPDFSWHNIPKRGICIKWPQKYRMQKIYQMAINAFN